MTSLPITVAILAGGAATRLGGRDKGLEPIGGRPLVMWVIDAIVEMMAGADSNASASSGGQTVAAFIAAEASPSAGQADVLIVANRHLADYSRYAPTICDEVTGFRGPLAGVAAALSASATDWLLTVPVDCPEPPVDLADRLIAGALQCRASCCTVHDGERRQPLFALYRGELAQSAAVAAEAGWGVCQWQASILARELDFSDRRRQFQNLNTPDDFAAYAKLRFTR